ncbi:NAD-dependent succinate-semialdehyde dehydrogenase [Sporosarcina sp. NCCP-2716]|uniref:NAD-dependent succinate-semialdehyde dehydrogenase n=1 Tax=Sporosarcina sp. NCCP-2716 TaxID=2943679 RepID=UPI002084C921|nr:NAD-dependent succinate-semialdehyde dehydrogenase [Sporosarcina sp. NCCP-2716]GKV68744.1 NAD-dependent succinate-semialdehyde dehydrogenase [Sporosarcina sp. NCCP-2716]
MEKYEMIIGQADFGEGLATIPVVNPFTLEPIFEVPNGGADEAVRAVDAAQGAFPAWAALSAYERSALIMKWHALIERDCEELGRTMTEEQGKPLAEAIGEIDYANGFNAWYAEEGKRLYGETIPATQQNKRLFVHRQPVGVVAAITPWNFPAAMITRKVAPALAVGCTVVIKPSRQTPVTAIKLVRLALEAGIPEGVVNVVTGDSGAISDAWLEDDRVKKITFTGSTEVGRELMAKAAATVKKLSLELGGLAPAIVMEDSDLDKAADGVIATKFRNAGQTCVCANRVYVQESVAKEFTEKLNERVRSLKTGSGLAEGTKIGPLIDERAVAKVERHVADAVGKGAIAVMGGRREGGLIFEPTVLTGVTDDMISMHEETFGPVVPLATFKTEEEAIRRANDTIYGLAAYVFTENLSRGIRMSEQLEYGIVGLNDGAPSTPQAPFGGFKQSGLGREGGRQGIEEFVEVKYISVGL